jgi:hypothetical protein
MQTIRIAAAWPAIAATPLAFFGTVMAINALPSPSASCGGAPLVVFNDQPGLSNLGSFANSLIHCLGQPGTFEFDFGSGNTLFGTYSSVVTPAVTAFPLEASWVVTGGTGSFAGWGGSFTGNGYAERHPAADLAAMATVFRGQLVPVPEPATWGMLLAGLAAVASLARRRG